MAIDDSLRSHISDLVKRHRVVLFMKGSRRLPSCGFSAQVVQILDGLLPAYEAVDVLSSPELREGIKEFSQWPTIPQLYVDGQFVGGADIVREMSATGELQKLLGVEAQAIARPEISVSEAAVRAFRAALLDARGDVLRLRITPAFEHDLFLGPLEPGDMEVEASGITLMLDPATARLASGVSIDYVEAPNGGFKIDNPNAPASVRELSVERASTLLAAGELTLFDVRPEGERALASIAGARSLDREGRELLMQLDRSAPIAFHCHHGVRSRAVAEQAVREGFRNVYNLKGGIDAWSLTIDPTVPRY